MSRHPDSGTSLSFEPRLILLSLSAGVHSNERPPKACSIDFENVFHIPSQIEPSQLDGPFFAPAKVYNKVLGQNLRENSAIHAKFRQCEFQFVHVAVVADLFRFRHGLQPTAAVLLNEGRDIRVPPVAVRDDVREYPRVADQFLIACLCEDRDRKRDLRKRVKELAVEDQRGSFVEQVLPLENAGLVHPPVDTDHQVKRQRVLGTELGKRPEGKTAERVRIDSVDLVTAKH